MTLLRRYKHFAPTALQTFRTYGATNVSLLWSLGFVMHCRGYKYDAPTERFLGIIKMDPSNLD